VIRILPQNHDAHIRQGRQFEGSIDVFGSREYVVSPAFCLDESLQLPEIRFRKFIRCNRPPGSRKILRNIHNVSQGSTSHLQTGLNRNGRQPKINCRWNREATKKPGGILENPVRRIEV